MWGNCGCEGVCGRTHEKEIQMFEESKGKQGRVLGMKFQVAEVKKTLMSVKRIVESGNHVSSGPTEGNNFVCSKRTGDDLR